MISLEITDQKKPQKQINLKNKALPQVLGLFLGGVVGSFTFSGFESVISLCMESHCHILSAARKENPMVLDILCARKELAHQTFGL